MTGICLFLRKNLRQLFLFWIIDSLLPLLKQLSDLQFSLLCSFPLRNHQQCNPWYRHSVSFGTKAVFPWKGSVLHNHKRKYILKFSGFIVRRISRKNALLRQPKGMSRNEKLRIVLKPAVLRRCHRLGRTDIIGAILHRRLYVINKLHFLFHPLLLSHHAIVNLYTRIIISSLNRFLAFTAYFPSDISPLSIPCCLRNSFRRFRTLNASNVPDTVCHESFVV